MQTFFNPTEQSSISSLLEEVTTNFYNEYRIKRDNLLLSTIASHSKLPIDYFNKENLFVINYGNFSDVWIKISNRCNYLFSFNYLENLDVINDRYLKADCAINTYNRITNEKE